MSFFVYNEYILVSQRIGTHHLALFNGEADNALLHLSKNVWDISETLV